MFTEELLDFMNDNFTNDAQKILKNYISLQDDLENAINNIINKANQLAQSRAFKDAEEFLKRAEELSNISYEITTYTRNLDIPLGATKEFKIFNEIEDDKSSLTPIQVEPNNEFTLLELLEISNEDLLNSKVSYFVINNTKIDACDFKEVFIKCLTFLGNLNKEKAYKLPQSSTLNTRNSINFTFVKVKAMREPVEIKELGIFVETDHDIKTLLLLTNAILQHYSISPSEMKIYFAM